MRDSLVHAVEEPRAVLLSRVPAFLFCLWALVVLLRALPLSASYLQKLIDLHGAGITGAVVATGALLFGAFATVLRRAPRLTTAFVAAGALVLTIPSGNFIALPLSILIVLMSVLLGDALFRMICREEARGSEVALLFACGLVAGGLLILIAGELHILGRPALVSFAVILLGMRYRRIQDLMRSCSLRLPERLAWLDSFALAFVIGSVFAVWVIALTPDVSWDALMYHLPEIRDIVTRGRVELMPDLLPQTLFWRNHEAYLSIAYFFGGERAVRILHFFAGAATFGAVALLAKRLGRPVPLPLLLLAVAAFPLGMYQMRATYVDWVCALLVTMAAAALLDQKRRAASVLAGFLFGGAIATKIFAVFAVFALLILILKPWKGAARRVAGFALGVALSLGPWMVWSQIHAGFILAPLAPDAQALANRVTGGYFLVSPTLDHETSTAVSHEDIRPERGISAMPLLPWTLTYESSRFEAFGNGYGGVVALMLLFGVFGWSFRHFTLFLLATVPSLTAWFLMYAPSSRYLMPLYLLYVVFAVIGLTRLTRNFAGPEGRAAAAMLVAGAIVLPVHIGSSGVEWKTAFGILSREEALAIQSPGYPLMQHLTPRDRVIFFGEFDRYHCPAETAYRVAFSPVHQWESNPVQWRSGLRELGITHILYHAEFYPHFPLLKDLEDMVELRAENGIAQLYRVHLTERDGSGPPSSPGDPR